MKYGILIAVLFVALLAAVVAVIELVRIPNMYEVEGEGIVKYRPDAAHLTVSAYYESEVSNDAIAQTATTMHNLLEAMKAAGVKDDDVKTKGIASGPLDNSSPVGAAPAKRGYYADQSVVVTVHDAARVAKLLEVIAAAGSNAWQVDFFVSDPQKLEDEAHRAAFADAKRRAEQYAADGGFRRGAVLKIAEGFAAFPEADYAQRQYNNVSTHVEVVTVTGSRLKERRDFVVPAPQEQTVKASVAVLFEIK